MIEKTIERKLEELEKIKEEKKNLEEKEEGIKDQIKKELGEKEYKETKNFRIYYTITEAKRFDTEKFKELHKKMYENFLKKSTTRRFSFNRK